MRWGAAALSAWLVLTGLPGTGGTEPEERSVDPNPPPVVTLDALPLGIPLGDLPEAARDRVEGVLGRSLFAQRVSGIRYRSRGPVFEFLLDHPDLAASIARALRLGEYRVTPLGDGYWGDDNRGARGRIRILHAEPGRRLLHLEGRYEARRLPVIEGQLLVLLEYRHETDDQGGGVVEQSLTGHLRIDTPIAGAVAQLAAAISRPLVERAVERKVRRFFNTVARVSRWAYDQPEQLAMALEGHPEVPESTTLATFRAILLADRPPAWANVPFHLTPETPGTPSSLSD